MTLTSATSTYNPLLISLVSSLSLHVILSSLSGHLAVRGYIQEDPDYFDYGLQYNEGLGVLFLFIVSAAFDGLWILGLLVTLLVNAKRKQDPFNGHDRNNGIALAVFNTANLVGSILYLAFLQRPDLDVTLYGIAAAIPAMGFLASLVTYVACYYLIVYARRRNASSQDYVEMNGKQMEGVSQQA